MILTCKMRTRDVKDERTEERALPSPYKRFRD